MDFPKISIIIPIYNVEKYLDRCIQSLLKQTLKEIEIIMVDDESPDNCPAMCDEYAKSDNRIKVIHKKNAGLGLARNTGLHIATGKYIAFVDSDDYVDKTMYETLYNKANSESCDIVFCGFYKQHSLNSGFTNYSEFKNPTFFSNKKDLSALTVDFVANDFKECNDIKYDMSVWHSIYLRENLIKNHIEFISEREYASEDIPFQIDFLKSSIKVAFIPNALYYYCYNQVSLTKKFDNDRFCKIKKLFYLLNDKINYLDQDKLRVSRLFFSNARICFRSLVSSNLNKREKLIQIRNMIYDDIWIDIQNQLLLINLKIYQKIFLYLLLKRKVVVMYYFLVLYNKIGKGFN